MGWGLGNIWVEEHMREIAEHLGWSLVNTIEDGKSMRGLGLTGRGLRLGAGT